MEGAGEGVVAILEGTKHAGLRVTLVPDNRLRLKRKCMVMDLGMRPPTRITQSSVETNTERVIKNASAPVCDVRYASRYQFANCKSVQSSIRVSEFPQHSTFYRHSDQFADSLRKYPVQASSEILQRIINYSNIKQNTKKPNLRGIRSSLCKFKSQHLNRRYDSAVNTNYEMNDKRPLNKSISTIGNIYSSQKELLNYTYDYLKCISLIPRCTDVRYLTQVKRCIRNRLLDIIDDRPAICPRIRSRYSRHKRHFHGSVSKPTLNYDEKEIPESSGTTKLAHTACVNSSYPKRKSCFCQQPNKCHCKTKLSKHNPLETLLRNLYPDLNVARKEIPSKQIEPKLQTPGDLTREHDDVDDKLRTEVSEWLKSIPVYPNFNANDKMKQEELIFKLIQKLISLKNNVDFISKAKMEIMLCVNELPMWYPPNINEKEQFIVQIVGDLLKRLINILENELKCKVVQAISNLPYTEDVNIENIVDDFVYKINSIVFHPPEDERDIIQALKPRILDLLSKLQIQCTIEKIHDIADKLVNQLIEFRFDNSYGEELTTSDLDTFRENIIKWCKNVPELESIDFAQNIDLTDELANKFKYYESRRLKDKSLQTELVKAIRIWLEEAANEVNLRLNSKTKNRLSNKMANHFFGRYNNNTINRKKSSENNISEDILEPLLKWYNGIQELAGGKRDEDRRALNRLAKELKEIQSRDHDFDNMLTEMKGVITVWLQNMLTKRDKCLESKEFDNFVNKLILQLNDIPKFKKQRLSGEYGQCYRDIITWIKEIPYLKPGSHLNQNKLIERFSNKLNNIHKESDNRATIIEALEEFIQSLSESLKVHINERDIQILKDKLFERLTHESYPRKRWDKEDDLRHSILSEMSDIFQEYSIILSDTKIKNIKDKIYRKLTENMEESDVPNWNQLLRQINNLLKQETLPKSECEDLANDIIARMQRMFPREIKRRSTVLSQPVKSYVEPARIIEQNFDALKKHKTQKDSISFKSAYDNNKTKRAHCRKINPQAGDGRKHRKHSKMSTIYKSSNSDLDMHDSVDYYNNKYKLNENQNDHSTLDKQEEYWTSTPLITAIKKNPSTLDVASPIGNVTEDTKRTLLQNCEPSKQYLRELKNVIKDWIKILGLSINIIDLNDLVDGIACDIIDRQKYLQLSEKNNSENDELEHLKYEIFRKLNKFQKIDTLPEIISKINHLYRDIKNISVPDLIKPVDISHIPTKSVNDNIIFNKISHWLDSLSPHLLKSNIKRKSALINELVQNLEKLLISDQYDYQIEKDILLWLQNILRNYDGKMFYELAEDLKSNLKETSPEISNMLKKYTNHLIDDNIFEAIVVWLQAATFYKKCTTEERYLQEILALLLTTNLKNILQTTNNEMHNLNALLMEEIQKYLETIPMATEFKNNNFYNKAAGELVEYLKKSIAAINEMFDDINNIATTYTQTNTPNDFIDYKGLVKNIINDWCDNLPIHLGYSAENKEQVKKLKGDIAKGLLDKLSYIKLKEPNNDNDFEIMLSDEIHKMFANVPMNRELKRSLSILKSILIEKLKQANLQTKDFASEKVLHDTLTKTLQEIDNTPDLERASLNLLKEKLADAFINLNYHALAEELRDKLKEKLYDEINKFCYEYLERYPQTPIDSNDLRFNLYAILKKVSIPDMEHPDINDKSQKMTLGKEVMLKNATTQYSSPQFLPSTLSLEDKDHLEIIRKRATDYPERVNSELIFKDLSPKPKEIGVQTDYKENVEENVQTSETLLTKTINSNKEILPQVVIKEFYWDSSGSKQNLEMFVPPALTPHKIIPRKNETNHTSNQTETNIIDNSTKVHISQKLPDIKEVSNNKADSSSDTIFRNHNKKQEHLTKRYLNSLEQGSQNEQTSMSARHLIHKQQEPEEPFHEYHKKNYIPGRSYDNSVNDRHWIEQPRTLGKDRYIRNDRRQSNYSEDLVKIPDDRRILTQRIFYTPESRSKEMCCDYNANWRMGADACRRRCNTLKHCSKCCGGFCPHPSFAFFKKTF